MKILFVVDDFSDGAGNIAQILAVEYARVGYSVSLMLTNRHSLPRYCIDKLNIIDNKFLITKGNIIELIRVLNNTRKIIMKENPDVVISFINNNNTIVGLSLINTKIPLIVSERTNPYIIVPRFQWKFLRNIAYKRSQAVSVQFEYFKGFSNGAYIDKCIVTPNVIIKPTVIKKEGRKSYNRKIVLITCARLAKIKRLDIMIDIFSDIHSRFPNTELLIYGEGKERVVLEKLIKSKELGDSVFLKGSTSDIYECLCKADIYLMTSEQEGFPNSLSEAMAIGLPSVSFKCHAGLSELVENGVNGLLVNQGDKEAFICAIEMLICDTELYERISIEARKVTEKYSMERVMEIWNKCIQDVITKRN